MYFEVDIEHRDIANIKVIPTKTYVTSIVEEEIEIHKYFEDIEAVALYKAIQEHLKCLKMRKGDILEVVDIRQIDLNEQLIWSM
ncbi:hypothetical protein [Paenibacillus sp. HB172176]|uniref:hypothetical protein n=1 Tax=Paenibacillus sp. HB172176 TaxID=2493690 RepID=UPI00143BA49C|nr:hypothetical protein [Paenibacillus sp. HB172176]